MTIPARPTVREVGDLYRSGDLSPVEYTLETLRRIEATDPVLNAYVTVTRDHALRRAEQAERELRAGRDRGPLHGIVYAAKDLLDTAGVRTTVGSRMRADHVPQADAEAIERLDRAGAILVGKALLHEWAYGITSTNPHFGAVRNPWDPSRIPGGSSGGSAAAVAAGTCTVSIGSDTGGSIRIPGALCGITGLKPTYGRISLRGAFPLGHTLDTLGPFGTCVEDVGLAYAAMAGLDPPGPGPFRDLAGTVLGLPDSFFFEHLAADVQRAVGAAIEALRGLGAEFREVTLPDVRVANSLHRLILLAEAASVHGRRLQEHRREFGEDVRALLDQGRLVLATDYLDAQRMRQDFCRDFSAAMKDVDGLVLPAIPIPTARIGQLEVEVHGRLENVRLATTRNVRALNLTGLPVLSLPCGFHGDGLPIGLQVVGKAYREDTILKVGRVFERATDWHRKLPPCISGTPSDSVPAPL